MAKAAEYPTPFRSTNHIMSAIRDRRTRDLIGTTARFGDRGKLTADVHQTSRDAIGLAAAPFPRKTLPQSQRHGRGQTLASQLGQLSRKLIGFAVLDAQMLRLPHSGSMNIFYY